ncbi:MULTISPECIES: conjugal transfer protein TraF [unclassified Helicobacter]|uniref:conjugal transfer protein TraF n=1 Tax=unclassified Helicobacter TaxID=2593540 RepID=UPI000CF03358|nr:MULTISPECIES: conjugal transfer protein TraF [unclassified Helicobacter]
MNKKILLWALAFSSFGLGLDFGNMGNTSISMGGAGVALQSSAFGAYYNPALISIDNKVRFGFTLGGRYQQKNIDRLIKFDFKGMLNNANSIQIGSQNSQTLQINEDNKTKLTKLYGDFSTLMDIFEQNHLSFTSQNGISLQISPAAMRGTFGSLAISYFASLYSNISAGTSFSGKDLIIKTNGNAYYKVDSSGNVSASDENSYKNSVLGAIEGDKIGHIATHNLLLSEVPITYARTFFFSNSNLDIGINLKYMNAILFEREITIKKDTNINQIVSSFKTQSGLKSSHGFGVDLGITYGIDLPKFRYLTFGFVAKNINTPTFKFSNTKVSIKPQYRVGFAYNQPYVTIAFDADILPNEMFAYSDKKQYSQMIGGGLKFDLKAVDMRVGMMKDIRQDNGLIITSGLNILGIFDIAFQVGTKAETGSYMPRYMAVQVGGGFSF